MSNIDRVFIDDLLSRIDIVDVIGEVVKLKKAGANHKGLCPFHSEKTPSFNVSSAKQFYHCFGCGASGDAIKFLREHEGLSFVDAVEKLASMANMEVPKNNKINQEDMGLYEANNLALQFFINSLNKNKVAIDYLISRGIDTDMIKKFDIGYAADSWDSLKKYLYQNKKLEAAIELGLVVKNQDKVYDRFRNRIMFPIKNNSGRVIAFGGRTTNSSEPKYLNSPDTKTFKKKYELYGLYEVRQIDKRPNSIFVVEGYMDVIGLFQHGVKNSVASSGTAFTQEQLRKILNYTNTIYIVFDGDDAGSRATLRGIDLILEQGVNVKICNLPKNEDPDSFVSGKNIEEIKSYFNDNSKDFIVYKASLLNKSDNDPVKKAAAIRDMVESISKISDQIKREIYVKECSLIMDISEQVLYSTLAQIRKKDFNSQNKKPKRKFESISLVKGDKNNREINALYELEKKIIEILLLYGNELIDFEEEVFSQNEQGLTETNLSKRSLKVFEKVYMDLHLLSLIHISEPTRPY